MEASKNSPRIGVVTVNWNRPQDTLECLCSLKKQVGAKFDLYVVDNGSTDGSVQLISQGYPDAVVISVGENLGFARGFNCGIRHALHAGADYVLLLNNDTVAADDMLCKLLSLQDEHPVVVGPLIYRYERPKDIWSAGGKINRYTLEIDGHHESDRSVGQSPVGRDFLSGCSLLVPRVIFETVGLFDERFFMYYEDLDFCIRVKRQGFALWLHPQAKMWHKASASSGGAGSPNERFNMAKSSILYYRKHGRGWQWPAIVSLRILSALRLTISLVLKHRWASLRAYWNGLAAGLR